MSEKSTFVHCDATASDVSVVKAKKMLSKLYSFMFWNERVVLTRTVICVDSTMRVVSTMWVPMHSALDRSDPSEHVRRTPPKYSTHMSDSIQMSAADRPMTR